MHSAHARPRNTISVTPTRALHLRVLQHILWIPVQAVHDAARAWSVTPHSVARDVYDVQNRKGSGLAVRWRLRLREWLGPKIIQARITFLHSLRLRLAEEVLIPCLGREGLLSNLLHVLEVLHRVRPDARVHVDWVLTGTERGFRYGHVGEDVWAGLFRALSPRPKASALRLVSELDFAFWRGGKYYLTGRALQRHRSAYQQTLAKWVEVTNPRVRNEVEDIYERSLQGRFCIGVHRRVGNAMVAANQPDGMMPSIEHFLECVNKTIPLSEITAWTVFLATDDAQAVPPFRQAFGDRLSLREQVQRTTTDDAEVHFRDWDQLSLADAEDVLIDTLLLSRCTVLVHASSSISTVASLLNPTLQLVRVTVSAALTVHN
jgi:hypothetical protein